MSFNMLMIKQAVLHTFPGIQVSKKQEQTIDTYCLTNLQRILLSEKSQSQKAAYWMFHLYNNFEMTQLQKWRTD